MTDEAKHYRAIGKEFAGHSTVHHTLCEYVDPEDAKIHTNTVEGYFSIFKRGMKGAVADVVGIEGGVISGLSTKQRPALARRWRSRHDDR